MQGFCLGGEPLRKNHPVILVFDCYWEGGDNPNDWKSQVWKWEKPPKTKLKFINRCCVFAISTGAGFHHLTV